MPNIKYTAEIEILKNKYKGKGDTIFEALEDMGLDWPVIKNKGFLKIESKNKYVEKLFLINQLRRMFSNKTNLNLWAKRLEFLLKDKNE